MRVELAALKQRLGTTMVYVTHDQTEAMTLADRIVVMNAGRIEQTGAPLELYRRPANRFVARFIGSPRMNVLPGGLLGDRAAEIGVRPEDLRLGGDGLPGTVTLVERVGADLFAHIAVEGAAETVIVRLDGQGEIARGARVRVAADPARFHRFGADGARIES